jgi:hypothetical protein
MRAEDKKGGVILFGEELQRGGVLERVDGVLLGEFDGPRSLETVQLCDCELDDLRG